VCCLSTHTVRAAMCCYDIVTCRRSCVPCRCLGALGGADLVRDGVARRLGLERDLQPGATLSCRTVIGCHWLSFLRDDALVLRRWLPLSAAIAVTPRASVEHLRALEARAGNLVDLRAARPPLSFSRATQAAESGAKGRLCAGDKNCLARRAFLARFAHYLIVTRSIQCLGNLGTRCTT
jgi:hypothetical protein